jgi:hypothetical protein
MKTKQAVQAVMAHATQLGLQGVMILSPVCPSCGMLHDFKLCSSLDYNADTVGLMKHFVMVATENDPALVVTIERVLQ